MKKNILEVGKVVTTHGVKGMLKIMPWADSPDFLCLLETVFIDGKEYNVERCSVQKSCVLMKLEGIDTVEDAHALREKTVSFDREQVELEEGTVYIADLIGLKVLADGREIGKITDVLTMPGNDVYVVKGEKSYMIPVVKEFVLEINVAEGFVAVRLIEGMETDAD